MLIRDIQSAIVAHFFSSDLMRYIEDNEYAFSGQELLSLADHFAPSYQEKLRLASMLSDTNGESASAAKAYVSKMNRRLNAFLSPNENEIYELTIQDTPEAYPEKYLCTTFETALCMIDRFYEIYGDKPGSDACYRVEKRRLFSPGDVFEEDSLGECILTSRKAVLSVCVKEDWQADEERLPLPEFPAFLPSVSPVKYRANSGAVKYGVYVDLDHPPSESCFVIPFDCEMMKTLDFKNGWAVCPHEHVPCPDVESVPLGVLPESMQEAYFAFVAWWEEFTGKNA